MELPNTYKALEEYSDRVIDRARKNLNTKGFRPKNRKINASGALSRGLGYKMGKSNVGLKVEFTSKQDYASIVEEGRKKGKIPPYRPLMKWIEQKGIRLRKKKPNALGGNSSVFTQKTPQAIKSAAIAMAKAIGRKKIEPTNFFSEAMEFEFKSLSEPIGFAIVKDLEDVIVDNFQKSKFIKANKS